MKIDRRFTQKGKSPYSAFEMVSRTSEIKNPDGTTVFKLDGIQIPESWSQVATDVIAQKYFRRAGVPQVNDAGDPILDADGNPVLGGETDCRQAFGRLAGCWTHWGKEHRYFDTDEDAQAFNDELCHMLAAQMAAPNSPQWFNTGLNWAYGITGPAQGHHYVDEKTGELCLATSAYERPQPHACFIQSVGDDLVGAGGIMDLWMREARLFKYGSGTGSNFSKIRGEGEPLSGGGLSSGLMSFLKIGDSAAGAIKSGGTTRRAAKMTTLDLDHPDIESFINWKVCEEQKVAALVTGSRCLKEKLQAVLSSCHVQDSSTAGTVINTDPRNNRPLAIALRDARSHHVPESFLKRMVQFADQGFTSFEFSSIPTGREKPTRPFLDRTPTTASESPIPSSKPSRTTMTGICSDGPMARSPARFLRASCGRRSPTQPGVAPTLACSTTPPSTSGTPAPPVVASMLRTPVRSTCSSTTPRVTWHHSTWSASSAKMTCSMSIPSATPYTSGPSSWRSAF